MRAADLRDPGPLATSLVVRELMREQLPAGTFGSLDPAGVTLAKAADRSVLGCMNDMAFMCQNAAARSGGLAAANIGELNRALRLNSARGYQQPTEITARRLR